METKKHIFREHLGAWLRAKADKKKRGEIIRNICAVAIDTAAHCGDSVAGDFAYTVNAADVATLWGARRAQWNKGQEQTVRSMEAIDGEILFDIAEWHPDTGSEFINWHRKGWADGRGG